MAERRINMERMEQLTELFGDFDRNIKQIEQTYGVSIISRGEEIRIVGDEENCEQALRTVTGLLHLLEKGETLSEQSVRYVMDMVEGNEEDKLASLGGDCIAVTVQGRPVKPKTVGQKDYIEAMEKKTVVLGEGPAGTGKTYLAVAMAVRAFRRREIDRIVLTRPAVEAGESLGFLPGDLQTKVDPYLRPLYDALYDMLGGEACRRYLEHGTIEVAPLAYMRGRTLDDSFIILDEAQNTTPEQMKMFLTRLGFRSKAVITGDVSQIDLPGNKKSGMKEALKILKGIDGIGIVRLSNRDVVRNPLVQQIIKAYDKYESEEKRM